MITPDQLRLAMEKPGKDGYSAFTKKQVIDRVKEEDESLASKIRKAQALGVSRKQALNFYAYGATHGKPKEKKTAGFFSQLWDYATAPTDAASGLIQKGLSKVTGVESGFDEGSEKELQENIEQTPTTLRVGLPLVAGLATAGASIPVSAAVSGAVGAGSSLAASGIEAAAGEEQTLGGALGEAAGTGLVDAAIDAATMGIFRAAKGTIKAAGVEDQIGKRVGKIVQSTGFDIEQGRKALQTIDTEGVETYTELADRFGRRLQSLRPEQDSLLEAIPGKKKLGELTTTITVGKRKAKENVVATALDHLEELYSKTGKTEEMLTIQNIREIATNEGLSVKELNDLARVYGSGPAAKGFSRKTGEQLTSVSAELHETTRKGLKELSRSLMPNDASKAIDLEMWNLIRTQELAERMAEAAQKVENKIIERGLIERVSSKVFKTADALTGHSIRGLLTVLPSDIGLKTKNALTIQDALAKNLAKLSALEEAVKGPKAQAISAVKKAMMEFGGKGVSGLLQGLMGKSIDSSSE